MFDKIKSLFSSKTESSPKGDDQIYRNLVIVIIKEIKDNSLGTSYSLVDGVKFSELKSYQNLKAKDVSFKKEFAFWLMKDLVRIYKKNTGKNYYHFKFEKEEYSCEEALLTLLFRSNLNFSDTEFMLCFEYFKNNKYNLGVFSNWPIGFLVQQLERKTKKENLSKALKSFLKEILTWKMMHKNNTYYGSDMRKVRTKIEAMLIDKNADNKILKFKFKPDAYGVIANTILEEQKEEVRNSLYQILHIAIKVSGGKPTQKFLKSTAVFIDELNFTDYKSFVYRLLEEVIIFKPIEKLTNYNYNNNSYDYTHYEFVEKSNLNTLKGLVWSLSKFHDSKTIILLAKLTEKCFKKIPGVGPTALALGNACLYTLANTKGKEGIAQLTVLKQKIKQTSTKKLIDNYIEQISEKLGVSKVDIEESIVSEFGLENGKKEIFFNDYKLQISIEKIGKVNSVWVKPDGTTQKTQPSFIKENKLLFDKIKKVKAEIREIQKFLVAQRNRLDSLLIEERIIDFESFSKYYLNHGLISFLAKKIIWIISNNSKKETCYYLNGTWVNVNHQKIIWVDKTCTFQLWHPIYATTNEILDWRNFLINLEIVQPLKQAFREIYLLTDAEINTKVYSNRMASHLIKQHQFNMLAKVRNWSYQLIGAWDHGSDCKAKRQIKIGKDVFQVEFWLNELYDDLQINDAGILLYMSTDQVRYYKNFEVLDLVDVDVVEYPESV